MKGQKGQARERKHSQCINTTIRRKKNRSIASRRLRDRWRWREREGEEKDGISVDEKRMKSRLERTRRFLSSLGTPSVRRCQDGGALKSNMFE